MYSYLLTVRCSPDDIEFFEEFLPIFFDKFSKNEYYWSIENDGTCDRHLHFLSRGTTPNGKDKVLNYFNSKLFQGFKERLKDSSSIWMDNITEENSGQGFINIKTVPKEDFGLTIGYILKDTPPRRYTGSLNSTQIKQYLNLYYINERNKAKDRDPELQSLKVISSRTMVSRIIDFCKRNDYRYDDPELYYTMVKHGYFFCNIPDAQRARAMREIRVYKEQELEDDKIILSSFNNSDKKYTQETQEQEDIFELLKILKTKDLNHFEFQKIKNIAFQNHFIEN